MNGLKQAVVVALCYFHVLYNIHHFPRLYLIHNSHVVLWLWVLVSRLLENNKGGLDLGLEKNYIFDLQIIFPTDFACLVDCLKFIYTFNTK